ncbi:MAG: hypothetical protein IIC13_08380 [SAR324 cluster bacterium]|nr:hypothetical protein [SAR324 cluster bacterium]
MEANPGFQHLGLFLQCEKSFFKPPWPLPRGQGNRKVSDTGEFQTKNVLSRIAGGFPLKYDNLSRKPDPGASAMRAANAPKSPATANRIFTRGMRKGRKKNRRNGCWPFRRERYQNQDGCFKP